MNCNLSGTQSAPNHSLLWAPLVPKLRNRGMITFGPIPSRRLGRSLGINNIQSKSCSFSCVYCQAGRTDSLDVERRTYFDPAYVIDQVEARVAQLKEQGEGVNHLSIVPEGEPTLDLNLGLIIKGLKPLGVPIAVISNAGFECVAAADQGLALAPIEAHLEEKLRRLLTNCRLQGLVKIDNPFDVTPMMNDACFAEAVAVLLEQYDFVVVGCVPLTPALATLPEEWRDTDIVQSLQQLGTHRRMITVIEGGPRYQPMRDALKSTNIPVFNRMDRAVRALQSFFHPLN